MWEGRCVWEDRLVCGRVCERVGGGTSPSSTSNSRRIPRSVVAGANMTVCCLCTAPTASAALAVMYRTVNTLTLKMRATAMH